MVSRSLGKVVARFSNAVKPFTSKDRAAAFARQLKAEYEAGRSGAGDEPIDEDVETAETESVVSAIRDVDWAAVRSSTAERTADAAEKMRAMAGEVDWGKVQPVAAQVSSALIAAVAAGQLPIGGRMGATVVRAIMNDRGLAQRVGSTMRQQRAPMPPDFRPELGQAIDTTATE